MNRGYVWLHRKTLESPVWRLPAPPFKVFIACLLLANHKDRRWFDGTEEIVVPRGSFITSHRKLVELTGLGRQAVRGSLRTLAKMVSLTTKIATNRYTMITVVNYDSYQGATPEATKVPTKVATHRQPTGNHKQEVEEVKTIPTACDSAPAEVTPSTRRPAKETNPNVKPLIDHHTQTFVACFHATPPVNGAKDGAIAKKLLAGRTLEEAKWLVTEHLTNPPDFYEQKNRYSLGDVLSAASILLVRRAKNREGA